MKGVWVGLLVVLAGRCAAQTLHALPALSSPATDLLLGFDGEVLYFGRSPAVVEGERLNFSAVRGVGYFEFSTPDRLELAPFSVPQWEGSGAIAHAAVDAARGMAVFSAPGKRGDLDLFVVHREAGGGWSVPRPLEGLNSPGQEVFPHFVRGRLVYGSDRPGGAGGYDLYGADREDAWSRAVALPSPFNGPGDDVALVAAAKGEGPGWGPCYLASDRGGEGGVDLWAVLPEAGVATPGAAWEYALEWRELDGAPMDGAEVRVEEIGGPVRVRGITDGQGWIRLGEVVLDAAHRVALEPSEGTEGGGVCYLWGRQRPDKTWIRMRTFRFAAGEVFVFDLLPLDVLRLPEPVAADGSEWVGRSPAVVLPFEVDADRVTAVAAAELMRWLRVWHGPGLVWPPDVRVEVRGHADPSGGAAYNGALALRRARTVAAALAAAGVPASAVEVSSAGSDEPPPAGISPRRVEVRLVWGL
jgi:hypothetical protein